MSAFKCCTGYLLRQVIYIRIVVGFKLKTCMIESFLGVNCTRIGLNCFSG